MATLKIKVELSDETKRLLHYMSSAKDENVECGEVWRLGKWKGLQPFPMPERPSIGRNATPVGEGKNFPGNGKAPREKDLIDCVDCQVFAREFHRRYPSIDEGSLLGWFATAIENGKSAGRREETKNATKVPEGFIDGGTVLHLGTGRAMMVVGVEDLGRVVACDGPEKITDWMINFQSIPRETYNLMRKSRSAARELGEALGLLTTLAPKMVIDADHPIKMAREIEKHVREVFEKCDESARTVNTMRADHDAALDEIVSEVPTSFRRSSVKESVKLLAAAFMGLREIFGSKT